MPASLLDPTIDIVFKLLLMRNEQLLVSLIEAVLPQFSGRISTVQILNPEIPKEFPKDKTIALDIRMRLQDGCQIDLEMQSAVRPSTRARFLYYWAKGFSATLSEGEDYGRLPTCISILWRKTAILESPRLHSIFHLSEDHSREIFAPELEFHVLELPKLALAASDEDTRLKRWARFFLAETPREIEQLAIGSSVDPSAQSMLRVARPLEA